MRLNLSHNSKTTQKGRRRNDGRASTYPEVRNSFGLPAGLTCPGQTDFCAQYCYATETEGRINVRLNLQANLDVLHGKTEDEMYELIIDMLLEYRKELDRYNIPPEDDVFRIHWDGDFFNIEYARAWRRAILENPRTTFWVYTHSFGEPLDVLDPLVGLKNLFTYISVDDGNIDGVEEVIARYGKKVGLAFCARTQVEAMELAESIGKKHVFPCPENAGDLPLITENGKGACIECRKCFQGRPNILFFDNPSMQQGLPLEVPIEITRNPSRVPRGFDMSLFSQADKI